jgi:hypothetical protein
MKIVPVGAELFHGDGQKDGEEDVAVGAFRNFAEASKL